MQGKIGLLDGAEHAALEQAGFKGVVFAQAFDFDQRRATCGETDALVIYRYPFLFLRRLPVDDVVNDCQSPWPVVQPGAAGQQGLGVRIFGCVENVGNFTRLTHLPAAHHNHLARNFPHQAQVVADEQNAHFLALLQARKKVHDLPLNRNIQRSGWLVSY